EGFQPLRRLRGALGGEGRPEPPHGGEVITPRVGEDLRGQPGDWGRNAPNAVVALVHHGPLCGADRKPKPTERWCSRGSSSIEIASSRCIGGITKRSSNVHKDVSR